MADVTVDEVVNSLVKEIENGMEYTISNSQPTIQKPALDKYQIPLQDIGNETMDMIVKQNTTRNCTLSSRIGSINKTNALALYDDKDIEEPLETTEIYQEDSKVKEYTLADYDLSMGSLGSIWTKDINEDQEVDHEKSINEENSIDFEEQQPKPLSTIVGLAYNTDKIPKDLPGSDTEIYTDGLNNDADIDINNSFILSKIINQDPFIMSTIFEDDGNTIAERINESKDEKENDYLSIWHIQDTSVKPVSPALSSHSRFSDGTTTTAVNPSHGTNSETASEVSNFKFKPRLISKSKIHYPNSRKSSDGESTKDTETMISGKNSFTNLRRISYLENSIIHSNDNHSFMASLIDASTEQSKYNPLDFSFTTNEDLLKFKLLTLSNSKNQEKEHIKNDRSKTYTEPEQSLEESLSSIIDFDKSDFLSSYLEHELGTGFGEFLNEIDTKSDNKLDLINNKPIDIGFLDGSIDFSKEEAVDAEMNDESELFEHFASTNKKEVVSVHRLIRDVHINSPVKVTSPVKNRVPSSRIKDTGLFSSQLEFLKAGKEIIESDETNETLIVEEEEIQVITDDEVDDETPDIKPLLDQGKLIISLDSLSGFELEGMETRNATFSVQCKIGNVTLTTPYAQPKKRNLEFSSDMVVIINEEFEKGNNILEISVTCKYDEVKTELVEVREKIPIAKKNPFRKTKYAYHTSFVQRAVETDRWDHLFSKNGEYCKGSFTFSQEFLKKNMFYKKVMNIPLKLYWAKGKNSNQNCNIKMNVCYIHRKSNEEILPDTLSNCEKIVERYQKQQNIRMDGYLLQDGGDLSGKIQRRFFELDGHTLTGYHETLHKPQISINLLNVKYVLTDGEYPENGERNFTNFTNLVLLSDCIQLIFENDEVISFSIEGGEEEKKNWYFKLKESVQLNITHQPWVKRLSQVELRQ